MATIKEESAKECVETFELDVRWHKNYYEFYQERSNRCGNFAIVEVGFVEPGWIREIEEGPTVILFFCRRAGPLYSFSALPGSLTNSGGSSLLFALLLLSRAS